MDLSPIINPAAVISILANALQLGSLAVLAREPWSSWGMTINTQYSQNFEPVYKWVRLPNDLPRGVWNVVNYVGRGSDVAFFRC